MSITSVAKIACLFVIGLPGVVGSQDLSIPPLISLAMAVAAFAAGLVLSELDPTFRKPGA